MEKGEKLPNEYFRDFPIEFKEINPSDFNSKLYNVPGKTIVTPNEDGYISDSLLPLLEKDFQNTNTTVINAGVGQGKTTAIMKMVEKFIKEEYVVIVAVPFKSLIEQYKEQCLRVIDEEYIFDIQTYDIHQEPKLKQTKKPIPIIEYKVHLVTVNSLLANSGNSLIQSSRKSKHFNDLIDECYKVNRKCIIIFDEIHAAIHNFKEHNIFRLWGYKEITHKIYTISATYNEASKEVIKYLSEITQRNIFIIETERTKILKKQSDLHVNIFRTSNIERDENFIKLLKNIEKKNKPFDILIYSKNLSKELSEHINFRYNKDESIEINKCYSDNNLKDKTKNKYNPKKTNIGTNFSTGVNIEKENHTYIVIFPKDIYIPFVNNKGVFSSGVTSVIQGLARQRKVGEIHIFIPPPQRLKSELLPKTYSDKQKEVIDDLFKTVANDNLDDVSYSDINKQDSELSYTYSKFKEQFSKGANKIQYRDVNSNLNRLLFPPKEVFTLDKGELVLTENFFGGSLSTYILWSAVCNQFLNCDLKKINFSPKIKLNSETLYQDLKKLYNDEVKNLMEYSMRKNRVLIQPFKFMKVFFNLMKNCSIDGRKVKDISKCMTYILSLIMDIDWDFNESERKNKKKVYHHYFKSCVLNSFMHHRVSKNETPNLVYEYQILLDLLICIDDSKKIRKDRVSVDSGYNKNFEDTYDRYNVSQLLDDIASKDMILNQVFNFKNTLKTSKTKDKKCNFIYKLLVTSCLNGKSYRSSKGSSRYYINPLEDLNKIDYNDFANLLYEVNFIPIEDVL